MIVRGELVVQEFRKGRWPHLWVPERVPDCPQRACRRARKCLRPEMVEGRPFPNWPSCPLVTNDEWAVWSAGVVRCLTGPGERLAEEVRAACDAARKAHRPRK